MAKHIVSHWGGRESGVVCMERSMPNCALPFLVVRVSEAAGFMCAELCHAGS